MPKRKIRKTKTSRKPFFRPIHLQAFLFIVFYIVISKIFFFDVVINKNWLVYFLGPYLFGVLASFVFLYLFSHEDFFHFIKNIEKEESKKEKGYLKKFKKHGNVLATIIIGIVGGPIFLALTTRFLLRQFGYRYIVILVTMLLSTIYSVALVKGIIGFI